MKTRMSEIIGLLCATGAVMAACLQPASVLAGPDANITLTRKLFWENRWKALADPNVKINIAGINAWKGELRVGLFDEKGWNGKPLAARKLAVERESATIQLHVPAPGSYGVKIYQDVNGNGALDKDRMGIPVEPIGFSNDAPTYIGPPRYEDAAFTISVSGAAQTITLRNIVQE